MLIVRTALIAASLSLLPQLATAQRFTITAGAVDDQVLQRDDSDHATINFAGTAVNLNNRPMEIRATGKHGPLPGLDWMAFGKVTAGKWNTKITLPTGGPYRIELRSMGVTQSIQNILVGDLWLLAGQSNMQGVGDLVNVELPNGLVHSFDQADRWVLAEEPLHTLVSAADKVHWGKNAEGQPEKLDGAKLAEYIANRKKGAGIGLPFAVEMIRRTGVPIGLLPCAHGGTSMDQWSPDLRDKAGDSLYGATFRRVRLAGGRVKGILWYQGESDANPKAAPEFLAKFEKLVASFRSDFGQPDLPFYYVQIGRHVDKSNIAEWNVVQEMQRKAEKTIPKSGMVPAADLTLDDGIHVSTQDLKALAKSLANLAAIDLFPQTVKGLNRGPRIATAKLDGPLLRVAFTEVNGRLVSPGRISGFTIHDPSGTQVPAIFKAHFDPSNLNVVVLHIGGKLPEGATLHYGAGKDPYCNVRDQAGMAVPVFGPVVIER